MNIESNSKIVKFTIIVATNVGRAIESREAHKHGQVVSRYLAYKVSETMSTRKLTAHLTRNNS